MKKIQITIELETDDPNYCSWCGKKNLTDDLCEILGCSEDVIEIEEVEE